MKKLLNILLLVCINYTVNAQITPASFTTPVNTGANMTVFLNASKFDQFEGGQIGAFYDLNGDGVLQCVGVESIVLGFSAINLWGDDLSTPVKDGLGSGESPGFAILYDGNVILVDEYPQFTGYMTNGFVDITDASFSGMGCYDGNNHYLPGSLVCFVSSSCYCDDNNDWSPCLHAMCNRSGCTDYFASNYDFLANVDDGSCEYSGCSDQAACNYNNSLTLNTDNGTCIYPDNLCDECSGETDGTGYVINDDYDGDGICVNFGCTDANYLEYDPTADYPDGSCITLIFRGCTDVAYLEYNFSANIDDESCSTLRVDGCTDSTAYNFDEVANTDDVSCITHEEFIIDSLQQALFFIDSSWASDYLRNDSIWSADYDTLNAQWQRTYDDTLFDVSMWFAIDEYMDSLELADSLSDNYRRYFVNDSTWAANYNNTKPASDSWNTAIDLAAGWNMFGYGCPAPIDLVLAISEHTDNIIILKDNNGKAYMPEFGFNGIGDLTPGLGYQIKVTEVIEGFSLCDWYVNDFPVDNIVSLQQENASMKAELDSLYGCTEEGACNFDPTAVLIDSSCDYETCLDDCGVLFGDNSSCIDACGIPNGDNSSCSEEFGEYIDFEYTETDVICSILMPNYGTSDPMGANVSFSGEFTEPFPEGSTIGIFYYDYNGVLRCGGSSIWSATETNSISAYIDDLFTPAKDGFNENEAFNWRVQTPEGLLYSINVIISENSLSGNQFSTNGLVQIGHMYTQFMYQVEIKGCMDEAYVDYNPYANTPATCYLLKDN